MLLLFKEISDFNQFTKKLKSLNFNISSLGIHWKLMHKKIKNFGFKSKTITKIGLMVKTRNFWVFLVWDIGVYPNPFYLSVNVWYWVFNIVKDRVSFEQNWKSCKLLTLTFSCGALCKKSASSSNQKFKNIL